LALPIILDKAVLNITDAEHEAMKEDNSYGGNTKATGLSVKTTRNDETIMCETLGFGD
jgi:hypothetical protein